MSLFDKMVHLKKECQKLKDQKEKNKGQNGQNANVACDKLVIMGDCGIGCLIAICEVGWIVDSVASFHATPSQNFFATYIAVDLGEVNMRNRSTSKIIGQGYVHVVINTSYNA